ncbi:MAG: Appr-1-p processing protein, partial [Candidatus Dechloromonas phosphoritropha]
AERYLARHVATHERLNRTSALVEGFETPYGLELLATVHWVLTQESARSIPEIAAFVHNWNPRKRQFTPGQIDLAANRLHEQSWA